MQIVGFMITLCGDRPEPANSALRFLNAAFDPVAEFCALCYVMYITNFGASITVSQIMSQISLMMTMLATVFARKWILKNSARLRRLHRTRRLSKLERVIGVAYLLLLISYVVMAPKPPKTVLEAVLYANLVYAVLLRHACMWFLMNLLVVDGYLRVRRRLSNRTPRRSEVVLRSYEASCRIVAEVDTTLDGLHDWFIAAKFLYLAVHKSMLFMSRCRRLSYLATTAIVASLPAICFVAYADQLASLMRSSRPRLRRAWLEAGNCHRVHAAMGDAFSLGLRWFGSTEVMNWATMLRLLKNVFMYGALVLTTSVFRESAASTGC